MTSIDDLKLRAPDWAVVARIGSTARIFLRNEIGICGSGAKRVLADFDGCREIYVTIADCLGGDLDVALEIFAGLANLHAEVTIIGRCHSSAVVVAMAGCRVRMRHDAQLLIHAPQMVAFGGVEAMERSARSLRSAYVRLLDIFSARTGQEVTTVDEWLRKDTVFTAAEALAVNLIDEVIPAPPVVEIEKPESRPAAPSMLPTDDEQLFFSMLTAMGEDFRVRRKSEFCKNLQCWLNTVQEISNDGPVV